MKKIVALLLILSLATTLFVVPTGAAWSVVDTTFAVASDLHYEFQEDLEWFSEDPNRQISPCGTAGNVQSN